MKDYFSPAEARTEYNGKLLSIYTKCNPAMGESLESGNYRAVWGVMETPSRMRVHIFEVVKDGCISNRSICYIGEKKLAITLQPTDKITMTGQRRYVNA